MFQGQAQKIIGARRPTSVQDQRQQQQSPALLQQPSAMQNIHAEQLRQITSDLRAGRSTISYPVLPAALRLSNLV